MPKCCKCHSGQSRLNKGGLCKACFKKKIDDTVDTYVVKPVHPNTHSDITKESIDTNCIAAPNDREIIDLIKDNMFKEKSWNNEAQTILKQQIEFLKHEIYVKNTLIENLLTELFKQNSDENMQKGDTTVSESISSSSVVNSTSSITDNLDSDPTLLKKSIIQKENNEENINEPLSSSMNDIHQNRFQVLVNDSNSSFETQYMNANLIKKKT